MSEQPDWRSWRHVSVPADRLPGWVERFAGRHGDLRWEAPAEDQMFLHASDGAVAVLALPLPGTKVHDADSLAHRLTQPVTLGLVLVRRGGFAVGAVRADELARSRCGRRYVQGRTSKGGWSQQRYARRRARQADQLVDEAADAVRAVLPQENLPLVAGGDGALVRQTLTAVGWTTEPVRWLAVGEPRLQVLRDSVSGARAVDVYLNDRA